MPYTEFNGNQLHFETLGQGRAIVLIHGFTNFGLSWMQQVPLLVHSGYRVILPDLYGHGQSAACDHAAPMEEHAAGIAAILEHLGIDQADICGLSLGGMVALQLALDRPKLVRSLVIADSFAAEPAMASAIDTWVDLFKQPDGPKKRLAATWRNLVNEEFSETSAARAAIAAWQQVLSAVSGESLINVARGMALFDVRARLSEITPPTLVIYGEADHLVDPKRSHELAAGTRGAQLQGIPGAGHISCLDSPDRFNTALTKFLAAH